MPVERLRRRDSQEQLSELLDEARIALADVPAALPSLDNFSLCHGAAGCADILIEAAQILDDPSWLAAAEAAAQAGIEHYHERRCPWPGGMKRAIETPDLMWGLAGIAWFYLRMADPQTPTVLAPPIMDSAARHRPAR